MTKKQTLHNPDPNADRQMFSELQALLEAELKKPVSKQDRALISELSSAIIDATIPESVYEESLQTGLQIQQQALRKRTETRKRSYLRPLIAVCTGLILLFVSNAVAIHATGYNLLELTYSIFDDSFEFRYPSDESSHVCQPVVSDDDPYGIRTECETKGFSPLVPKYLPEGAELSKVSHHETSQTKKCWFVYRNGSIKIMLDFDCFFSKDDLDKQTVGIPSDQHHISEQQINGITVVVSEEDQQYTAYFVADSIAYTLYTENLSETESNRILQSYFQ